MINLNLLHSFERAVARDYRVLTSERQERPLEPRYRRLFDFADVLDESIQLYRRHWLTFATVSALCLIPPGLFAIWLGASGALDTNALLNEARGGRVPSFDSYMPLASAIASSSILGLVFFFLWTLAVTVTVDLYLHAEDAQLSAIFGRALRRYLTAFVGACCWLIAVVGLTLVSTLPLILLPVGLVGMFVAFVGILFWWLRPSARRTWLKWLIVVCTPFGLPSYLAGVWSMYLASVVIERQGPFGALRRSAELVDRQWFRVVGVLTVSGIIVGVLQYIPAFLIQVPLSVVSATRGQAGLGPAETVISTAAELVVQVLFASLATIVYTLLFVDLRNRREGRDLAERLQQLEAPEAVANG